MESRKIVLMILFAGRSGGTDIENRFVALRGGGKRQDSLRKSH